MPDGLALDLDRLLNLEHGRGGVVGAVQAGQDAATLVDLASLDQPTGRLGSEEEAEDGDEDVDDL